MTEKRPVDRAGGAFPSTRGSLLLAVRDVDGEVRRHAWGELIEGYWTPVYRYLRWQWSASAVEAEDLTQAFFAGGYESDLVARYDSERARFRTYLRMCLDGFVINERKAAGRLKRGGGHDAVPLDAPSSEAKEMALHATTDGALDPEAMFYQEWVRGLFGLAVADLKAQCEKNGRAVVFTVFERYDLAGVDVGRSAPGRAPGRPRYAELAAELDLPVTQVTNYLAAARRTFRTCVLERLRRMTASHEELQGEAKSLLGIEIADLPGESH
jgi:RNA polymerase sigma factor (sigma-70 family)